MPRFRLYGLILTLLLLCPLVSPAQQRPVTTAGQQPPAAALESVLEKDSILIGDQVWWNMFLPKDSWINTEIEAAAFPELPFNITEGVEALSQLKLDSLVRKRRVESIRARILITSFDSGSYSLPHMPLYLKREDGTIDTLLFQGPDLYVNTIPIDTTSFEPYGIKPQMRYPITWAEVLSLVAAILFLAAAILLTVLIVKRRRENLPVFGNPDPEDPPHIAALKVFTAIKKQELWKKQKAKPYYTLITDTLRQYLKGRWGIQAMEQTSAEMLASLQAQQDNDTLLTKEVLDTLSSMLTIGDLAKFAKYVPSESENITALDQAIYFVTHTVEVRSEE